MLLENLDHDSTLSYHYFTHRIMPDAKSGVNGTSAPVAGLRAGVISIAASRRVMTSQIEASANCSPTQMLERGSISML